MLSEVRGSNATEDESKHPDNVSLATLPQEVLPSTLPCFLTLNRLSVGSTRSTARFAQIQSNITIPMEQQVFVVET